MAESKCVSTLDRIYSVTKGERGSVIGAYMDYNVMKGEQTIVQLLNYDGAVSSAWVDSRGAQLAPVVKLDVEMAQSVERRPSHIYVMSPDHREGILQEVEFTYENGQARFTLPYLEYWDMVVINFS